MSDKGKLVYVVDDDDSVRRSIGFMLKTLGYRVRNFESGIELLRHAGSLEPGCIMLDIRMPGMDGLEVQQALRERGIALPVIIITGHGDVALSVRAMKAGAIDFVEKPFKKEMILSAITEGFSAIARAASIQQIAKDASVRLNKLSSREREVLDGLAEGLPNKTIAYHLGISPRTVEIHRANLMTKLDVRSLSAALRLAFAVQDVGEGNTARPEGATLRQ